MGDENVRKQEVSEIEAKQKWNTIRDCIVRIYSASEIKILTPAPSLDGASRMEVRIVRNPYIVLGIQSDADQATIKRQYRELSRIFAAAHNLQNKTDPISLGLTEIVTEVNVAYEILSKVGSRSAVDIALSESGQPFREHHSETARATTEERPQPLSREQSQQKLRSWEIEIKDIHHYSRFKSVYEAILQDKSKLLSRDFDHLVDAFMQRVVRLFTASLIEVLRRDYAEFEVEEILSELQNLRDAGCFDQFFIDKLWERASQVSLYIVEINVSLARTKNTIREYDEIITRVNEIAGIIGYDYTQELFYKIRSECKVFIEKIIQTTDSDKLRSIISQLQEASLLLITGEEKRQFIDKIYKN